MTEIQCKICKEPFESTVYNYKEIRMKHIAINHTSETIIAMLKEMGDWQFYKVMDTFYTGQK